MKITTCHKLRVCTLATAVDHEIMTVVTCLYIYIVINWLICFKKLF